MINVSCPHCHAKLKIRDELAGKRIRCPHCQGVQEVPLPSQEAATVPPRPAAQGRTQDDVREDATVPPSSPPLSDSDTSPGVPAASKPTITWNTADDEPGDGAAREFVKGGFVYEVEGEIARGGMGAIMRAVDQDIHREVAVKFLLNHADNGQKTRFIEEAQITGQLEHPNIVPIHQLGVHEDGRCFFSMKMVKGRSLADILKGQGEPGTFTLVRLLNIFSSICNALSYAHSRHVIHRDLKPANVMVGDFGEVYVMDWGLAKVLGRKEPLNESNASKKPSVNKVATSRANDSQLTQAGAVMGTPAYMPPEQAAGEAADQRSDIYSLGAILYEILTLSPPVGRSGDQLAVLMRVLGGDIKPPEQQAPERTRQGLIPPELSAVALKALSKDPDNRYQTVEGLQRDIQLYLEGRSVSAKRDTAWQMFKKLVKRNKGVSAATAAALVVLTCVVSIAFTINYQERLKAEKAREKAEENYQAFVNEQEEKRLRTKKSVPAFLEAARLAVEKRQWENGLAQVQVALDYDPERDEAYLLKGQLLMALERFADAAGPFKEYARRLPESKEAARLAQLTAEPNLKQAAFFLELGQIFQEQNAITLHERMMQLAEPLLGEKKELFILYRKRIQAAWPGLGGRLSLDKNSNLKLDLQGTKVRDLTPIKDMKLSKLRIGGNPLIEDLSPLTGMPLTELNMYMCSAVKDLRPLAGMKLTELHMGRVPLISDLSPLREMPLKGLHLEGSGKVTDLEPLRGMNTLEVLVLPGTGVGSLEPLRGLKLKKLNLHNCRQVKDVAPLEDMPLEWLDLTCFASKIRNFEPLRRMPLKFLSLGWSPIRDLDVLRDMPLNELHLGACRNVEDLSSLKAMKFTTLHFAGTKVRDLEPLRGMPLKSLQLPGTVQDFNVLHGMPLTYLVMQDCVNLKDLDVLRGMKLEHLSIVGCNQVRDLGPLTGMPLKFLALDPQNIQQGMDMLRGMKTLDRIGIRGRDFDATEFWRLHKKGEFK